jgi:hypothetical protein
LGDVSRLLSSLLDLGWVSLYSGDLDEAARFFYQCVEHAVQLDDKSALADVTDGLARVAAGRGHQERAARLLAAAEASRRTLGIPLAPADLERFEEAVAQVRSGLGELDFAQRWAEGERLQPEDALQEAIGEAGRVTAGAGA